MKITYLELPDVDKLISYHQHDYKVKHVDGRIFLIDGGQDSEIITTCNSDNKAIFKREEISELIEFIRNDYYIKTPQYNNVYLKDVGTNFLLDTINKKEGFIVELCKEELNYRRKQNETGLNAKNIANIFINYRNYWNLTQTELGKILNLTKSSVCKLEKMDENSNISIDKIIKLLNKIGIKIKFNIIKL